MYWMCLFASVLLLMKLCKNFTLWCCVSYCLQCFDAVGWAAGRASGLLKQCWGADMVICLERGANDLLVVQLMPLLPRHLCFSKIQNGLSFWYRPTQVVLEKRTLNDCVCVCLWPKIVKQQVVIYRDYICTERHLCNFGEIFLNHQHILCRKNSVQFFILCAKFSVGLNRCTCVEKVIVNFFAVC